MSLPFIPLSEVYANGERNFQKFYLENADLQGVSLPEIDLTEADLTSANLQGADLSQAILCGALLAGANLKGAVLHLANLSGANLRGANLEDADLSDADLSRANLRQAVLTRANLTRARLVQADASGVLERVQDKAPSIQRVNFSEAVLREANLSDANLCWSNLQAALLNNAKLMRTDLTGAVATPLKDTKGQTHVVSFAEADLTMACLRKAQLAGDFRKANLNMTDLRLANVTGDFREADLSDALLLNTIFNGSNFTDSKLTHVYLESCKLNKCLMPNGKASSWDSNKFAGEPPNPTGKNVLRKQPTYTEFWFETFEELRALSYPMMCVCCCRPYERYETINREITTSGIPTTYEVKLPYCTACLQHHIRTRNVEQWMKSICNAPGGNYPAAKFELKSKGMLGGRYFFVLSFASQEYTIGFAAGNQLPMRGSKSSY
jgi:uncharacterized protein YjbI with pentapeptide repeats